MKLIKKDIQKIISDNIGKADFLDIRIIESEGTSISFSNKDLEEVSKPRGCSVIARVLKSGGWGYATFNSTESIKKAVNEAVENSNKVKGDKKTKLAKVEPVQDRIEASEKEKKFLKIPLKDKVEILQRYNNLIWERGKIIVSSSVLYSDMFVKEVLVNSEGSFIEKEKGYVVSVIRLNSKKDDVVENYTKKIVHHHYDEILGKDKVVKDAVDTVEELVQADNVRSGIRTVVLSPSLAGVFAHEAFGHLSEADNVYQSPDLAKVMKMGRKFGSEWVTIIDDPTIKGLRGSHAYDDEGTSTEKTVLLDKGVLVNRLHSRETAGTMGEKPNGHARAQGASEVMPRMGTTYIEAGQDKFKDMLENTEDGLYCVGWQAGNTDHERFTFTAAYGVEIKNGKLGKMVRNVKLAGNLFDTLLQIDMVGDDLEYEGGTCGKSGQNIPECSGAPHIRIKKIMVMGV